MHHFDTLRLTRDVSHAISEAVCKYAARGTDVGPGKQPGSYPNRTAELAATLVLALNTSDSRTSGSGGRRFASYKRRICAELLTVGQLAAGAIGYIYDECRLRHKVIGSVSEF